jgi:hypothetical protein
MLPFQRLLLVVVKICTSVMMAAARKRDLHETAIRAAGLEKTA